MLPPTKFENYDSAAQLYSSLRKKGIKVRYADDCLIVTHAIHFDLELCHNNSDFELIAANSSLKIWKPNSNPASKVHTQNF